MGHGQFYFSIDTTCPNVTVYYAIPYKIKLNYEK